MKKLLSMLLVLCMVLSLAGCGSDKAHWGIYEGNVIRVQGEEMPIADVYGGTNEMRLEKRGKGTLVLDGDNFPIKWKADGETLTVTINGSKSQGTIADDVITLDVMDVGMEMVFAKQGKVILKDKPDEAPEETQETFFGTKDTIGSSLFEKLTGKEKTEEQAPEVTLQPDAKPDKEQQKETAAPQTTEKAGTETPVSTPASTETPAQPEEKPLAIRKEPAGVTADEGETVLFKVEAEGGKEPYTYQWSYKNSGLLGYKQVSDTLEQKGSKTDALKVTLNADHFNKKYEYRCVVTDAEGNSVISAVAKVTAKPVEELIATVDPKGAKAAPGDVLTFTATAKGGKAPYAYSWQIWTKESGSFATMGSGYESRIKGMKTDTMKIEVWNEDVTPDKRYRCEVTDANGNTVYTDYVDITAKDSGEALAFKKQPADVKCKVDERVQFKVAATGGAKPYTYTWQVWKDDIGTWEDSSQKGDTIDAVAYRFVFDNNWKFRCVVTDALGKQIVSNEAKLIENIEALQVQLEPSVLTVGVGESRTIKVQTKGGAAPLSYKWQFSVNKSQWKDMPGEANSDALTITATKNQNGVYIRCIVTDAQGNVQTTSYCRLKVEDELRFEDQPNDVSVNAGEVATFSAQVAGGAGNYSAEWQYKMEGDSKWYTANAYGMQYYIDADDGDTACQVKVNAASDAFAKAAYRCVVYDGDGTQIVSDSVRITVK